MDGHIARERKLVAGFNSLSDESKTALLARVEALCQAQNTASMTRVENRAFCARVERSRWLDGGN